MAGGVGDEASLEFTPTWIVASVCTILLVVSFLAERILHAVGKCLLRNNQGSLFLALQKIKEELMLLGFVSLLLAAFQSRISKICIPMGWTDHWLPCSRNSDDPKSTVHVGDSTFVVPASRLLSAAASEGGGYCTAKGKAPLLSAEAMHGLHIFIFMLAISHVVFSVLTLLLGSLKIRQWRHWEEGILNEANDPEAPPYIYLVEHNTFIQSRYSGIVRVSFFGWLICFFKQFFHSVSKEDYTTLRLGFVKTQCPSVRKFNFYKYMTRALENDFEKVVGISWYLWIFIVLFLLLNVYGWHAYFWISFIPLPILLAVGTKLEHIIIQLAREAADKNTAVIGDLVVEPSDYHFWFHRPRLILVLIHMILFQNAFEFAVFFWVLALYGSGSCIMGSIGFIIPRLVMGVFVQILTSFCTLPLYAIVTQMGTPFKKAMFNDNDLASLASWSRRARRNVRASTSNQQAGRPTTQASSRPLRSVIVQSPETDQRARRKVRASTSNHQAGRPTTQASSPPLRSVIVQSLETDQRARRNVLASTSNHQAGRPTTQASSPPLPSVIVQSPETDQRARSNVRASTSNHQAGRPTTQASSSPLPSVIVEMATQMQSPETDQSNVTTPEIQPAA